MGNKFVTNGTLFRCFYIVFILEQKIYEATIT